MQSTNTSGIAVASGITHSAAQFQPARFVLAERLAPRINRVQRDMINALRISICAKSPKLIVWSPTRADTIAHLSADGLIHVK